MYKNIGIYILLIGAIINFGADRFYKKGKIKDMKSLLKIKLASAGASVVGLIIAIYMYN